MNKTLIFSISAAFLTLVCGGCTETNQFFDSPVKPGTSVEEPEPEPEPSGELCAFPGAEGFGRNTTGGRGGKVYHVTTLADGTQSGMLFRKAEHVRLFLMWPVPSFWIGIFPFPTVI